MDYSQESEEIMGRSSTYIPKKLLENSNIKERYKEKYITSNFEILNSCDVYNGLTTINDSDTNENNNSTIEDMSDSGVNFLDSESSELFIESICSQNEFDNDNKKCNERNSNFTNDDKPHNKNFKFEYDEKKKKINTEISICNSINEKNKMEKEDEKSDVMLKINNMTNNNSTIEGGNIIYRNKTRNDPISKVPKKRVSFHEDILKNTRTDNIHIEHGFITYKNSRKVNMLPGRHSWCSNVESNKIECENQLACRCSGCERKSKSVAFRNACSDVLDYGNVELYENLENIPLKSVDSKNLDQQERITYSCSNPSLNSVENLSDFVEISTGGKKHEYTKSSSCESIGVSSTNNYSISKYCYFSEPSIEEPENKEGWRKERKPKNSCLKKTSQKNTFRDQHYDLNNQMQKFNMHELKIFDKSKIFGTFRNIFGTDLPERGIPEGLENIHSVCECAIETDIHSRKSKDKAAVIRLKNLSKSLDGDKHNVGDIIGYQNKFIHNVDEQLRKKEVNSHDALKNNSNMYNQYSTEEEYYPIENSKAEMQNINIAVKEKTVEKIANENYRNKYIINCVSTVFEHTGVSCIDEKNTNNITKDTVVGETLGKDLIDLQPIKKVFANMFKSIKFSVATPIPNTKKEESLHNSPNFKISLKEVENTKTNKDIDEIIENLLINKINVTQSLKNNQDNSSDSSCRTEKSNQSEEGKSAPKKKFCHIKTISPIKRNTIQILNNGNVKLNPDLFDSFRYDLNHPNVVLLNGEVENMLKKKYTQSKIKKGNELIRYIGKKSLYSFPSSSNPVSLSFNNFLKASDSVLINRFLHDVAKNKALESSVKNNVVFINKVNKTFSSSLYIKGAKPLNKELIINLNKEIQIELQMSRIGFHYDEILKTNNNTSTMLVYKSRFQLGIGEIPAEIFKGNCLHLLNNRNENLMKVFKLYAGYSKDGLMTPVLVFLTDKALYVRDLVENRLCNKYIFKYSELDIILMGPSGNTILLSNVSRDIQKVLLAGGPYTAEGFVANLELCVRQGGFFLPTVGQLTLDNFGPLQTFVRRNLFLSTNDNWIYYAIVNSNGGILSFEKETVETHIKGFLMYKQLRKNCSSTGIWHTGYFLLRSDVLCMFNDNQKIPSWTIALSMYQGCQRADKADRPHCFEIFVKDEILQLAAPDEYVVSEWLQALTHIEKRFVEIQKQQQILGCTLIMTSNCLVTLRENFTAPLNCNTSNMSKHEFQNFSNYMLVDTSLSNTKDNKENSSISTCSNECINTFLSNSVPNESLISSKLNSYGEIKKHSIIEQNKKNYQTENPVIEVLTIASITEISGIRVPSTFESWWCILEFSCLEASETINDLPIFFSSSSEMQRFLRTLENLWQAKNIDLFPLIVLDEDDVVSKQCTNIFNNISKSWIPLLTAALIYPA